MQKLAESTGGTAFLPDKIEDLGLVFDQIAAELRAQYLLQYYSNTKTPGMQFRRISVAVPAQPQLKVRARQGYYPKHAFDETPVKKETKSGP
jgi:Ca-activated chloride channel family protein